MEEFVYKIRHKKTGMFFKSARINISHLSKKGNVYVKKPNKLQMTSHLCCCIEDFGKERARPEDWELITYKLVEV